MTRVGKNFELGFPYLPKTGGISYNWPNESYESKFLEKKVELIPVLEDKIKEYIKELEVLTMTEHYPICSSKEESINFIIGTGCRCFTLEKSFGDFMINFHNIDAYSDCFLGFNIASDVLEYLDDEIKAPRILRDNNYFVPEYHLPKDFNLLPANNFQKIFDKGILQKMFNIVDLGLITETYNEENHQEICCNKGIIEIRDGVCKGLGFDGWYAKNVTFPIAMLLKSCND